MIVIYWNLIIIKSSVIIIQCVLNYSILRKPAAERSNLCIDTGVTLPGAPVAPGDNAGLTSSNNERATRVSLAGVFATGGECSADLAVRNSTPHGVGLAALAFGHDGNVNGMKDVRGTAALPECAPAGDGR